MIELLYLYALGVFFAAGQKSIVLIALDEGVLVSHNKPTLVFTIIVEVLFWFITVPLTFSSAWRQRAALRNDLTGALAEPIQPEAPQAITPPACMCPNCNEFAYELRRVCRDCNYPIVVPEDS